MRDESSLLRHGPLPNINTLRFTFALPCFLNWYHNKYIWSSLLVKIISKWFQNRKMIWVINRPYTLCFMDDTYKKSQRAGIQKCNKMYLKCSLCSWNEAELKLTCSWNVAKMKLKNSCDVNEMYLEWSWNVMQFSWNDSWM